MEEAAIKYGADAAEAEEEEDDEEEDKGEDDMVIMTRHSGIYSEAIGMMMDQSDEGDDETTRSRLGTSVPFLHTVRIQTPVFAQWHHDKAGFGHL